MENTGIKEQLVDVLTRLVKETPNNTDVQVKLKQFCTDYIQNDEELIKALSTRLGVYGMAVCVPYLTLIAHIFLVTGMRFTHDFGCPEAIKDLFSELQFFKELGEELEKGEEK